VEKRGKMRSFFQLMLATRTIFDNLPPMLVLHFLPAFAFVARTHTANAKAGFAVEFANIDTR
jgi:hypothetical protein